MITFDEHGGFYDRRSPPATVPPDDHREEYDFARLGVRIPALLVSPWVANTVSHVTFDHTSLLKYAIERWRLGALGKRTAAANSIGRLIRHGRRREASLPDSLPLPRVRAPRALAEENALSDNEQALALLGRFLEQRLEGRPRLAVSVEGVQSPQAERDATVRRFDSFLAQAR